MLVVFEFCRILKRRNGGDNISKEKRIKELERQRRQYLNDYKMGLRKAREIVAYIREIDAELAELKEK